MEFGMNIVPFGGHCILFRLHVRFEILSASDVDVGFLDCNTV
jgi:hypothetical protein